MILNTLITLVAGTAAAESIPAPIAGVTVHADRSRVTRRSAALTADGLYRVEGLTGTLDQGSLRARVAGGHVLSVELRPHPRSSPPSDRLGRFEAEQLELDRELAAVADQLATLTALRVSLVRLAQVGESDRERAGDPEQWAATQRFLLEQGARDAATQRDLERQQRALLRQQEDLDRRRGELRVDDFPTFDVLLELDVPDRGAPVEVEYLVPSSGWEPRYELRTAKDARSVQVAYRARVWQHSGEDWEGVQLALSTAQPQRGAAAPRLETRWAMTYDDIGVNASAAHGSFGLDTAKVESELYDARAPEEAYSYEPPPFAEVRSEGLSLRYELPSTDTVLSGAPPTSVLVGTTVLGIVPEYHCAPALDTTVWLRGRATNDSGYTLLPGEASVFFGEDHLGRATLDMVRPGQDFILHLGPDHALTVERRMLGEGTKGPGFFGSKSTWHRAWSVRIANHGAAITEADDSAIVFLREALPRATDDRVSVSVEGVNQPLAAGEQWEVDRRERGIETWRLAVPRDGEAELRYELRIKHPEGEDLYFR